MRMFSAVSNVLQAIIETPSSPTSTHGVLPSDEELKQALTTAQASWNPFIEAYLNEILKPLFWNQAEIQASLAKVVRNEGDLVFAQTPPIDVGELYKRKATVDFLAFKLFGDTTFKVGPQKKLANNISNGYTIANAYFAGLGLPALPDLDTAVSVVKTLRAYEGCLIRVVAAQNAAKVTGSTLGDVLAFYRTEGDLVVPSKKRTLDLGIPPIETQFKYVLQSGAKYKPNISKGVWLTEKSKFIKMYETDDVDFIRTRALLDWFLVTIGFDVLEKYLNTYRTKNLNMLKLGFGIFSALTWKVVGFDPAVDKGEQRFDDLLNNLVMEETVINNNPILKVITLDPVKQMTMILTEGLIYMKALKCPTGLEYLGYHTKSVFSNNDPNKDQFEQILISAFFAASKTTDPRFSPLKLSLAGIPFPPKIKDYAEVKKLIEINAAPTFDPRLFVQFVNTSGKNHWVDWPEPRANLSRYNILRDYYRQLMA